MTTATEYDALLRAVLAGDHNARAALADYCEEVGDPAVAFWRRSWEGATSRLDKLPAEAAALLPVVRDYWLSVGLFTDAGVRDCPAVREAVAAVYRECGLEPPLVHIWLSGPTHGAVGAAILAQVRGQVGGQVWEQVGGQVRGQIYWCGYGTQDAAWLSFYHLFDLCGLTSCRRLRPLMALSRLVGWWWPFGGDSDLDPSPRGAGGGRREAEARPVQGRHRGERMSECDALMRAVCEQPEDWDRRSVLADWMEENGRDGEAAAVRLGATEHTDRQMVEHMKAWRQAAVARIKAAATDEERAKSCTAN